MFYHLGESKLSSSALRISCPLISDAGAGGGPGGRQVVPFNA